MCSLFNEFNEFHEFHVSCAWPQASFSVGAIFSSELAGILANRLGFAVAFLSLAVVGMVSFVLSLFMPETQVHQGAESRHCPFLMRLSQSCRSWIA